MTPTRYIIFSDLDGSLLDHDTYDFSAALPALQRVAGNKIPLVLTSSKTVAEIRSIQQELNITHPFIVENGSAIYIPADYFSSPIKHDRTENSHLIIELGTSYARLREALIKIRESTGLALVGFGDLNTEQVQEVAGLTFEQARAALKRGYDEPFYLRNGYDQEKLNQIERMAKEFGFKVTHGSRFYHLMGESDKGQAVSRVAELYRSEFQAPIRTVGIGDTLNDLPMFEAVDLPILVRGFGNEYDKEILEHMTPQLAEGTGPAGWNEAVLKLLGEVV
ncbi:HAD-IIB family hydrolase [bacterium]|nr:HAD-IIB family hydrolase [bacterium]